MSLMPLDQETRGNFFVLCVIRLRRLLMTVFLLVILRLCLSVLWRSVARSVSLMLDVKRRGAA